MPTELRQTWGGSLHQTFRLIPPAPHLRPFLESDGLRWERVLERLAYAPSRARGSAGSRPDPKRYRDPKQVYETAGLLYQDTEGCVRVTALGKATLRWLDLINERNAPILGKHAAYALSACQLRNPTGAGVSYHPDMKVFPFAFIWRAMLALDGKISSDELNRAIFKVKNEDDLGEAIRLIRDSRAAGDDLELMGEETVPGPGKNDRIIPWMCIASFGWTLIRDKRAGEVRGYYTIPARMETLLREASAAKHRHRDFGNSVEHYVKHLSEAAALPEDLR